ncbi:alpha/beta fold hydrolase [Kitasatospora sp. NPDC127111]|uniref:alpha/beta fold hydrolase n=1 Tax=Kitasatospora sp. NPDC127111 TaxID=3345363 RepID=UPI00363DB3B9
MPFVTVGHENSEPVRLYYEDHGTGRPVVLIHGWPLNGASWEKQATALLDAGHRVITYDRRGFGRSDRPYAGYDYDTFAADLHRLLDHLGLTEVSLVGFSMGSGEVARYLGRYGSARIAEAVMIGVVPPFLLRTAENPGGLDAAVFEDIRQGIVADRPAFLAGFLHDFYNVDVLGGDRVSDQVVQYSWNVAVEASAHATHASVAAWPTDFRGDLPKIDVPTLIIHGDADRTLPLEATAIPLAGRIAGSRLVVVPGAPHGLIWTHAAEVNAELLGFLGA